MMHNLVMLGEGLLVVYASFLIGAEWLGALRVSFASPTKRFAYALLLGYGAFGITGFVCAWFGVFRAPYLWAFVGVIVLVSSRRIREHARVLFSSGNRSILLRHIKEWFSENRWLKILAVTWVVINISLVFVPLTGHDTLDYHFPVMQDLVKTGKLTFTGAVPSYKFFPVLAEIIYAVPIVLFHETTAPFVFQFLQYIAFVILLMLIYAFVRSRVTYAFLAPVAVLLTLSLMDLEREVMHGGYIDVMVMLFGTASTLLLIDYATDRSLGPRELMLSAILLGVALSMKYSALMFALVNVLFLCVGMFLRKSSFKNFLRGGAWYGIVALLISGFWYLKNTLFFGSPVYPMFSDMGFGASVNSFILPRTFLNFFAFPFFAFGQWFVSDRESSSRLIVLIYFVATYLSLLFLLVRREKITRVTWFLLCYVEFFLVFLFLTSHQVRFLLPPVIALPPLLGLLGESMLNMSLRKKNDSQKSKALRWMRKLSLVAFLILFIGNFHYFQIKFQYLTGSYTKAEYIKEIGGQ